MRYTPEYITHLASNEIFVFGSNEAGRHGAGAAKLALEAFEAEYGVGVGLQGQCYAIPTKNKYLKTLPLYKIELYVKQFLQFAKEHPELTFLTTKIGCGLAGLRPEQIAPMFEGHSKNVILSEDFYEYID